MSAFVRVTTTEEIPVGTMKSFEVHHRRIVIARTENGFFALADECTHDSAPIADGELTDDNEIQCGRHGARFKLDTGEVTAPPALVPLDIYEVLVKGNEVHVKLD